MASIQSFPVLDRQSISPKLAFPSPSSLLSASRHRQQNPSHTKTQSKPAGQWAVDAQLANGKIGTAGPVSRAPFFEIWCPCFFHWSAHGAVERYVPAGEEQWWQRMAWQKLGGMGGVGDVVMGSVWRTSSRGLLAEGKCFDVYRWF